MTDEKEVLVTKAGLAKLKAELLDYKDVRRKEVAIRLKEAIAYGDLSENSEYEAKDSGESTLLLNQQIQISKLKTKI